LLLLLLSLNGFWKDNYMTFEHISSNKHHCRLLSIVAFVRGLVGLLTVLLSNYGETIVQPTHQAIKPSSRQAIKPFYLKPPRAVTTVAKSATHPPPTTHHPHQPLNINNDDNNYCHEQARH